jgi:transcription elongation factor GreB
MARHSMSKAFVHEDQAGDDDEVVDASLRVPAGSRNYLTPAGYARLAAELDELLRRERPKVVEVIAWAASNGDRSENGDYLYGKKRLREVDRRIRFLNRRLAQSQVVDPERPADPEQVFFGATVTVAVEDGGEHCYSIVGIDEADAARGRISWTSPLARALLRTRAGDTVRFQSPAGWREYEVVAIRYVAIGS